MLDLVEVSKLSWDLKLLYVEDNEEARKSTLALFEDFFENITVGVDGADGFEKFKNDSFDLIFTDINMPKMDGLEMAKNIREIDNDIPIVVVSAHQETDFLTNSIKIKIDDYLFKPLNIDQFANILNKVCLSINDKKEILANKQKQDKREARRVEKIITHFDKQEAEQRKLVDEVKAINKHTRDSIEYAALIQGAILPDNKQLAKYFKDYFVHWMPKDTVGGDIYLFDELRHKDECLLMFIDCTGHGVPGAFVTMLVKAVESQVLAEIKNQPNMDISPAWIMGYFNKQLKKILKQEDKDSLSNAGWDGGIIYYNKKDQILKFAGAETPLFYVDVEGEFHTVKGNRYSVGYKKCSADYQYKETIIKVEEGMKFYCTTDGYLDQNGGEKDFPFSKKRFSNIIKANHTIPMEEQKQNFIDEMEKYETMIPNNDRNDDMTVIVFEIGEQSTTPDTLLEYDGVLTQGIIAHSMDILEHNVSNIGMLGNLSTMIIELTQNMMKYSKTRDLNCRDIRPAGLIEIKKDINDVYYVRSKNILSIEDKEKIEPKLIEIKAMTQAEIRKRYKELRRSGENTHENGGGIGFYEISKLATSIDYKFKELNHEKFEFEFSAILQSKKKEKKL